MTQPPPPSLPPVPPIPPGPPQTPPPAAPPAAPGHGYPQQPAAQPGQGHGQAPGPAGPYGQQPGQPGPYGAPGPYGQQPGPYGQQPGPYGGHPAQQPYAGTPNPPAGGGSGRNFFKGKTGVIVAAAAAALLLVAGGTYLVLSGDEKDGKPSASKPKDDPKAGGSESVDKGDGSGTGGGEDDDLNAGRKDGEARVLFHLQNETDLPRSGAQFFGPWTVGDTVVTAVHREVTGYSVADGSKKWSVKLATTACMAAPHVSSDGKIVLGVYDGTNDDDADCRDIQVIDAKNGKTSWKKPIPKRNGFAGLTDYTFSMSGSTVTVAGLNNSYGFRASDGKQLFGPPTGDCVPYSYAGGAKLIAAASCRVPYGEPAKQEIHGVDPATGKAKWKYALKRGWEVNRVYSVDPLVVSIHERDKSDKVVGWSIIALTDDGKLRSQMQGGKDKFRAECPTDFAVLGQGTEGCTGVAADASTFYMSTEPTQLTGGTNAVVAFDLNTGKPKWRSPAGAERTMMPVGMENGNVVVYMAASWDKPGAVATIAPGGGAPKVTLKNPESTQDIESGLPGLWPTYADGRLYITSSRVSGRDDEVPTVMLAFGK
ncbi:PQQ-binding-like beta-propeller repeat protein [Streptomyces sp. NPDC006208]|uniref:outer membrane protein assembly factor BamB family protein n=1 Tax=Streptomyces sp. NPDC006208 TaxID=3156734 RepID=UPI0033A2BF1C